MPSPHSFRLATLNFLNNPQRIEERIALAVQELRVLQPDAVCLQELLLLDGLNIAQRFADELGWQGVAAGGPAPKMRVPSQTAVITLEPLAQGFIPVNAQSPADLPMTIATVFVHGRPITIISAHMAWGIDSEHLRQTQALAADDHARAAVRADPSAVVFLGGDFNAKPGADTNRFFDGFTAVNGRSTMWVDAWTLAGTAANEMTTRNDNSFARQTAASVGIAHAGMVPARRIDYLRSFGWTYGRSGHPLAFGRWAGNETDDQLSISDHYGIWADFLLTP